MVDGTKIEWTDATLNVVNGCTVISPGCTNCYAMRAGGRNLPGHPSTGLTQPGKAGHVWTGEVRFNQTALLQPLAWKHPRRIFWNAHGDLFHDRVPDVWIDQCFAVMALTPQHSHQVLTKRSARMQAYFAERWQGTPARQIDCGSAGILDIPAGGETGRQHQIELACEELIDDLRLADTSNEALWTEDGALKLSQWSWPLPNVWLGVSVEDQARADERIPDLLATPAAVRFVSCEPLLGPVDLTSVKAPREPDEPDLETDWRFNALEVGDHYWFDGGEGFYGDCGDGPYRDHRIDWVIVGGESGPAARLMNPDWARSLRDQCSKATLHGDHAPIPFLFKQWGAWAPLDKAVVPDTMYLTTKANAGRSLDGVQHDGMPV